MMTSPSASFSEQTANRHWPIAVFLLIVIIVPFFFFAYQTRPAIAHDFRAFLMAGERFFNHEFLYANSSVGTNVTWPPFFAVFMVPFYLISLISLPLSQVTWYVLNIVMFISTLDLWSRIITHSRFGWMDRQHPFSLHQPAVQLTLLFVLVPYFKAIEPLQLNLFMTWMMSLGFWQLKEKNEGMAGLFFGLAIAIKIIPILIIPYLLYRRYFKTTGVLMMAAGGFTLVALAPYGIKGSLDHIQAWLSIGMSGGYPYGGLNQSVYAMVARWLFIDTLTPGTLKVPHPPVGSFEANLASWIHRLLYIATIAGFLWMLKKKSKTNLPVEFAFMIAVTFLFSPLAWRNYFIFTFPVYLVTADYMVHTGDKRLKRLVWFSFFTISILLIVGLFDISIRFWITNVLSHMTIGAIILLIALIYILIQYESRPEMKESD